MNKKINFEFSKEGFESRFMVLKNSFTDSIFTKEEYKAFRESEMNEIIKGSGNSGNFIKWIIILFLVFSLLLIIFGLIYHYNGALITGFIILIPVSLFWKSIVKQKETKIITIGDRQEIVDHLLINNLISNNESKDLHKKIIDTVSN